MKIYREPAEALLLFSTAALMVSCIACNEFMPEQKTLLAALFFFLIILFAMSFRSCVVLDQEGIMLPTFFGFARRRALAWTDITEIKLRFSTNNSRHIVILCKDGSKLDALTVAGFSQLAKHIPNYTGVPVTCSTYSKIMSTVQVVVGYIMSVLVLVGCVLMFMGKL